MAGIEVHSTGFQSPSDSGATTTLDDSGSSVVPISRGSLQIYQSLPNEFDQINQVLIICHGHHASPIEARDTGIRMAQANAATTLVLAPDFVAQDWPQVRIDTLQDLDRVFDYATSNVSNAKLVLAGFSAGGQLVQRYSLVGKYASKLNQIIIGAASSYAYWTSDRPAEIDPSCSTTYNEWKYGTHCMEAATGCSLTKMHSNLAHYLGTPVQLMVGSLDNDPKSNALDQSCQAEAQGTDHYNRMKLYLEYVQKQKSTSHTFQVVDDVGHSLPLVLGAYSLPPVS